MERSRNKVVNCHWFGGSTGLPPNTIYIGRPSQYGNAYSSKSGLYTREECIALNRIDLYRSFKNDIQNLNHLKKELEGKDLACWCKKHKRLVGCHGDNYLHILSDRLKSRTYDKSVIHYLMDDLRWVMSQIDDRIRVHVSQDDYLFLLILFSDVRINIQYLVLKCKEDFITIDNLHFLIAKLVIDLELALFDTDLDVVRYRFSHVNWIINKFLDPLGNSLKEPSSPQIPPIKKKKT